MARVIVCEDLIALLDADRATLVQRLSVDVGVGVREGVKTG